MILATAQDLNAHEQKIHSYKQQKWLWKARISQYDYDISTFYSLGFKSKRTRRLIINIKKINDHLCSISHKHQITRTTAHPPILTTRYGCEHFACQLVAQHEKMGSLSNFTHGWYWAAYPWWMETKCQQRRYSCCGYLCARVMHRRTLHVQSSTRSWCCLPRQTTRDHLDQCQLRSHGIQPDWGVCLSEIAISERPDESDGSVTRPQHHLVCSLHQKIIMEHCSGFLSLSCPLTDARYSHNQSNMSYPWRW